MFRVPSYLSQFFLTLLQSCTAPPQTASISVFSPRGLKSWSPSGNMLHVLSLRKLWLSNHCYTPLILHIKFNLLITETSVVVFLERKPVL